MNSPTKSMSYLIYKVDLWIERLEYFIANRDKPGVRESIPYPYWTLPNSIEGFFSRIAPMNSDPVLREWNCYVPKHNLFIIGKQILMTQRKLDKNLNLNK